MKTTFAVLVLLVLLGCDDPRQVRSADDQRLAGVAISDANDRPEFKRVYETTINARGMTFRLKVDAHCFWSEGSCNRYFGGEITQPDDKWVLFDPKSPADKIIDRDLVPLVADMCNRIIAVDESYMKPVPTQYTDVSGAVWQKKETP